MNQELFFMVLLIKSSISGFVKLMKIEGEFKSSSLFLLNVTVNDVTPT